MVARYALSGSVDRTHTQILTQMRSVTHTSYKLGSISRVTLTYRSIIQFPVVKD